MEGRLANMSGLRPVEINGEKRKEVVSEKAGEPAKCSVCGEPIEFPLDGTPGYADDSSVRSLCGHVIRILDHAAAVEEMPKPKTFQEAWEEYSSRACKLNPNLIAEMPGLRIVGAVMWQAARGDMSDPRLLTKTQSEISGKPDLDSRHELDALGHGLAYDYAVQAVEGVAVADEDGWLDLRPELIGEAEWVDEALKYLSMRGIIESNEAGRIKIRDESEATR
jgi:hypothetical protein